MQRRAAFLMTLSAATLALTGCESESRPAPTATLLNNKEVHDAVKSLIDAVDGSESDVRRFDGDDWKDVVGEVRAAASGVSDAVGVLRKALGYTE